MGSANVRWLLAQLPDLVASGVLDAGASERLRAHYAPQVGSRRRWVYAGLGVFGAALIGAGVTMLLAHNWEALSRPVRAAIALGLLAVAQTVAGFAYRRRPDSVAWREGSALGWVMALGASLGLITQTYHLAVQLGDFLALWTVLALPAVWIVRSRVATALAWCGAATATMTGLHSRIGVLDDTLIFWGFAALLLPTMAGFARRLAHDRLATLPFWFAALWLPIAGIDQMAVLGGRAWVLYFPALFAGLHALGRALEPPALSPWRRPLWLVGSAGTSVMLLVLSFTDMWDVTRVLHSGNHPASWKTAVGTMVVAGALALWQAVGAARAREWTTVVLLLAPLLVVVVASTGTTFLPVGAAALACSACLLAVGLLALVEGARSGQIGMANAGLALLAALAIARFFDADVTLVARGIGFLVVGLSFLATNVWLLRRRHGVEA